MTTIPNELWMNVFEELDSPRDLASVVSTTKRFKALGTRVLYRHIIWTDPLKFIKNHRFLQQNTHLRSVTRALTIGISTATSQLDRIEQLSRARAIVDLEGDVTFIPRPNRAHEARILDETGIASPVDHLASDQVTNVMYNHALTFTNLRDLTFNSMVLPDTFFYFVHHFPLLDKLAIENCTPPVYPTPTHFHPRVLPITELTITGLRGPRRNAPELRAFGEAQQLRVVRFDSTCYIYKHFSEMPPNAPPQHWNQGYIAALPALAPLAALPPAPTPPPMFPLSHERPPQFIIPFNQDPTPPPHIHTVDVKFPTQKSWQSYVSEPHDQLINPFAEFLVKCPRIVNLRIRNYLPWLRLPDAALQNLANYQGPLTTIKSVVTGARRIKHLTIRDPSGGLAAVEKAFKEIEANGGGTDLETLSLFIGWWDDEILYAVLHHFSRLKRLDIMYKEGDPTEDMVLGMGAHFFGLMPRLWSVRIFKAVPPGDDNAATITDSFGARHPHRSIQIQIALSEFMGADSPERSELDDAEFDEIKLSGMLSSSSVASTASTQDPEQVVLKELVQAWNRYCPLLREVQLRAGYMWRRAGPYDAWAQRTIKTMNMRSAWYEEL